MKFIHYSQVSAANRVYRNGIKFHLSFKEKEVPCEKEKEKLRKKMFSSLEKLICYLRCK
jgi:hypothetical protein